MSCGTIKGDSNPNNVDVDFGGAVYVSGGNATITGGTLLANKAEQNGGAICIEGGSFTISGGMIQGDNNHALADAQLGGAVYVSGGNAHVNGGTLSGCSANSGGAIYVNGGTVTMLGGSITGNKATAGNGGAIYVTGTTDLNVTVQSGEISGNSASANGGAICVQGVDESTNTITVQIGVNELHYTADGTLKDCDHNGDALDGLGFCPIVKDNVCDSEGGAIYIVGTKQTQLNIYCIEELGNRGAGNVAGSTETSLSDFLKVDGGTVLISATDAGGGVYYGDSRINSSIHVTGGDLTLSGTLTNPAIFAPITVDVVAKGGSYTDARTNDKREGAEQYYVIKYFENFKVGEGDNVQATGRYTVHQALITEPHTIWGIIYSYTGYTIVGWNTVDDGTGTTFEVSSKIEYEDFKVYMKGIALELYAIWSKDYYWIQFEPNADVFSGTMGNGDRRISFDCAEPTQLPVIGYVNLGYRFLGWHTDPDAAEAKYTNNQTIAALSQTFGEIIKLYAIWIECDHSNDEWHAYTGADNTITCTCACSYFVTVTLVAPKNAVYDGLPHPAQPIFTNNSNDKFNENLAFVNWAIAYSYTPFEVGYTTDKVVTDAGNYTATLTYEGFTAKIDFTISKATQNAPAIPTFTTGKLDDDRGYLLVDQTETIDAKINYVLEYTTKDENGQATQHRIQPDDTYTEGIRFNDFSASWTLYYVVAWYSGNNNYEESVHVKSKQTYIYKGDISIVIIDAPNMQTSIVEDAENDRVSLVSGILHKDWYISSAYSASASGTLTKPDYADIVMENVFSNYFERSVTVVDGKTQFAYIIKNAFDDGYSGTITISFTGVKQAPIVSVSVAPNEVFGDVTDTNTEISADSAFTAYFEIAYFVDGVYASPVLRFGTALPSGTTIILVDKSNGSY
jgi:predicted outer membrane repeat protein